LESVKKAGLPESIQPELVEWLEDQSPFGAVKRVTGDARRIIVEQNARLFIYQGISDVLKDTQVDMAPQLIRMLRMIKSKAELEIMRCANSVTELAIKTIRPHIKKGMTELEIQKVMETALYKAGLTNVWVLALIDENSALPHGSSSEKKVTEHSTVLIDTGGELLGKKTKTILFYFILTMHSKDINLIQRELSSWEKGDITKRSKMRGIWYAMLKRMY
jgi:Xaa-Pro aminopeptidase